MTCEECDKFHWYAERLTADPYNSSPADAECADGDFGERYPCGRMLDALEKRIAAGLETEEGRFYTRDALASLWEETRGGVDLRYKEHPYWWIDEEGERPKAYDTLAEIYEEWFC
jgi:hypothetical protein